ncbi:MAG: ATP-grasp domain-containing protein [Deltaproteobacteria bacterium]|nr:ATP-grasp domain-containing protein [Deltaproteobacteria bacterium]
MARIKRLLVANRGEIALRIISTAKRLGLETIAVFSDADRREPFVSAADGAIRIGPPPAARSYLDSAAVLGAAKAMGADAIHPGYGFLSENANFAEAVEGEGLVFVGPPSRVIREMGDKRRARHRAVLADVPVVPGYDGADQDDERLEEEALRLGFPVLVKASAGGGGKGMVVVREPSELTAAIASARRVAKAAFGDETLLLERYVERPRHVEIQIFGDKHGRVVHLFERECSIQRRHQKLIEESPSAALDPDLRRRMTEAAVRLGHSIGYENAGTVEMLVGSDRSFYFLEVNTRLQVEHAVTEAVLGLDLVEVQLRVAEGEPLPFGELSLDGVAIECRLYAEDPKTFLPATGTLRDLSFSSLTRVDAGVAKGSEIGIHYDPLLAKIVSHGRDRSDAIAKLTRALQELSVHGVVTNKELLLAILAEPDFGRGDIDTHFIERHVSALELLPPSRALVERAAMAVLLFAHEQQRADRRLEIPSGYRNNRYRDAERVFEVPGHSRLRLEYRQLPSGRFRVSIDGKVEEILLSSLDGCEVELEDGSGVRHRARVTLDGPLDDTERRLATCHLSRLGQLDLIVVPRFPVAERVHRPGDHLAPMPGRVVRVLVRPDEVVRVGDVLVVLEAMKMEQSVRAAHAGVVRTVEVVEGQQVQPEALLVTLEGT